MPAIRAIYRAETEELARARLDEFEAGWGRRYPAIGGAAIEPVIGHLKAEHRMDRNYLKGFVGDRANAVLAAAGYNFRLLLRWLAAFLCALIQFALLNPTCSRPHPPSRPKRLNQPRGGFFTNDS